MSSAAPDGGATLRVEAHDNSGAADVRPEILGPPRAADRQAGRSGGRARRSRQRHLSRQRAADRCPANGIWCSRATPRRQRMFLSSNRVAVELAKPRSCRRRAIFPLCEGCGCGPRPYRSRGRGRQLRRLHGEDRARTFGDTGRHAGARQPDRPPRGAGMEAGRARPRRLHRSARRARLQGLSVRDGPRRDRRGRAIALPAALPRRRGVRRHERDDAVDPGLVRQRRRHAAGAARFLSLAVGADRAAGRGLCRPAVLPLGVAGAARRQRQYGRADQHRRHPRAWHVGGRDHATTPSTPISTPRSCC